MTKAERKYPQLALILLFIFSGRLLGDEGVYWNNTSRTDRLFVSESQLNALGDWADPSVVPLSSLGFSDEGRRWLLEVIKYWSGARSISASQVIENRCPDVAELGGQDSSNDQSGMGQTLREWAAQRGPNVFVGEVVGLDSGWNLPLRAVATLVTIRAVERLAGDTSIRAGAEYKIVVLGGWLRLGPHQLCLSTGRPGPRLGEQRLFFTHEDSINPSLQQPRKSFPLRDGSVDFSSCHDCALAFGAALPIEAVRREFSE